MNQGQHERGIMCRIKILIWLSYYHVLDAIRQTEMHGSWLTGTLGVSSELVWSRDATHEIYIQSHNSIHPFLLRGNQ